VAKSAICLSEEFSGHLGYLEQTRNKMERLFLEGSVVNRDMNQVYVGLYFEAITSFERLIEELFVGLLSGRFVTSSAPVVPLLQFSNRRAVRSVVYGGRDYVDWLPYDRTEDLANRFFRKGVPFTSLDTGEKTLIRSCLDIRNAIAHKSRHSVQTFERRVLGSQNLMQREKTPPGYLRSIFRTAPIQRRYQYYVFSMSSIAHKLCS